MNEPHDPANLQNDDEFLSELDSLDEGDLPDGSDAVFPSAAPSDDSNPGPELGEDEILAMEWEEDRGIPAQEIEPAVDHFVDGKRVRPRARLKRALLVLALLGAGVGIFFLIRQLGGADLLPQRTPSAWEQEQSTQRVVVLRTRGLVTFAPALYRAHIASGMDLELRDNGKTVPDSAYTVEYEDAPLFLPVVLDIQGRDPARLAVLVELLRGLTRTVFRKEGVVLPATWQFHLRSGARLIPLGAALDPETVRRTITSLPPPAGNQTFLVPFLVRSCGTGRHAQLVYISDRPMAGSDAPEAVALYNLLKGNPLLQVYRFLLREEKPSPGDMFSYLAANPQDFHRPPSAFGDYLVKNDADRPLALFSRQLTEAPPLAGLRIVYRPPRPEKPEAPRRLELLLRLSRTDSELSRLAPDRFHPSSYRWQLPQYLTAHTPLLEPAEVMAFAKNELLLKVSAPPGQLQYWAGRIAAGIGASLRAVNPDGLVLLDRRETGPFRLDAAEGRQVRLLVPHPYFRREWHGLDARGGIIAGGLVPGAADQGGPPTGITHPVFAFLPGRARLAGDAFAGQQLLPLGMATNKEAEDAAALLGSLVHAGWNLRYRTLVRAQSTVARIKDSNLPYASGYEIITALEWLAARFDRSPVLALFDTAGIHPAAWEGVAPEAGNYLKELLTTLQAGGGWVLAPDGLLPDDGDPGPGFLRAGALLHDGRTRRPRDPGRLLAPAGRLLFPLPGTEGRDPGSGLTGKGDALAAARLLPAVAVAAGALKAQPRHEVLAALQDGVAARRSFGLPDGVWNRGIITPPALRGWLAARQRFFPYRYQLTALGRDAYASVDRLLPAHPQGGQDATGLSVVPQEPAGSFFRTYQFFDRSLPVTGYPAADAVYDAATPFPLGAAERKELAVVSHRGLVFLLCTRNRHRGWIINIDAPLAAGSAVHFDPHNRLAILATDRGEVLFLDLFRGILLPVRLHEGTVVHPPSPALRTDHVLSGARLLLDAPRRQLWVLGEGDDRVLRLTYSLDKELVLTYDPELDCHRQGFLAAAGDRAGAFRFAAAPVLFPSGTVNLIIQPAQGGKSAPVYVKIDKDGRYF